jgi:hypothetical protein
MEVPGRLGLLGAGGLETSVASACPPGVSGRSCSPRTLGVGPAVAVMTLTVMATSVLALVAL